MDRRRRRGADGTRALLLPLAFDGNAYECDDCGRGRRALFDAADASDARA
jgi:hypothetical protein